MGKFHIAYFTIFHLGLSAPLVVITVVKCGLKSDKHFTF